MTDPLPYLVALGAIGLVWDGVRRWTDAHAKRTEDKFVTRPELEAVERELLARCDKNTAALESHAKHAAEYAQKTEAKFNAVALQRGRVS